MPIFPARGRGGPGAGGSAARLRTPPDIFSGGNRRQAEAARDAGLNTADVAEFAADTNLYIILRYGGQDRYQNRVLNQWRTITNVARGPTGAAGRDGTDGKDGATGPRGPAGPQGERGEQGFAGRDGRDGVDGKDGATGPRGAQGPKGDQGEKGDQGDPGPQGPQGPAGRDGTGGGGTAAPAYGARLRMFPTTFKDISDIVGERTMVLDELQQSLLLDGVSPIVNRVELTELETGVVLTNQSWVYAGGDLEIRFTVTDEQVKRITDVGARDYFRVRADFHNSNGVVASTNTVTLPIGSNSEYPADRSELTEQRVIIGRTSAELDTLDKFNFLNEEPYTTRRVGEASVPPKGDFEDYQAANYGGAFATEDLPDPRNLQIGQWAWDSTRLQAVQVFENRLSPGNEFRDVDVNRLITSGSYRGHWPTDRMALDHIQANGDFYSNDSSGALRVVRNYVRGQVSTERLELDKLITAHEPVYSTAALSWDIHPANLSSWTADDLEAVKFQITISEPAPVIYNMYYEVRVNGFIVVTRRAWVNVTTLPDGALSSTDAANIVANLNNADHLDVEISFYANMTTIVRSSAVHRRINLLAAGGGGGGAASERENIYTGTNFQVSNGRLTFFDVDEEIDPDARYQVAFRYPQQTPTSATSILLSGTFQGSDLIARTGSGGSFSGDFAASALAVPVAKAGSNELNHNLFLQYGNATVQGLAPAGKTRLFMSFGHQSGSTFMDSFYKLGSGGGGGGVDLAAGRGLQLDGNGRLGLSDAALQGAFKIGVYPFHWIRGADSATTIFIEVPFAKPSDNRLTGVDKVVVTFNGFNPQTYDFTPSSVRSGLIKADISAINAGTISGNLERTDTEVDVGVALHATGGGTPTAANRRIFETIRVPILEPGTVNNRAPNVIQDPVAGGDSSGVRNFVLPANYQDWKWLSVGMWNVNNDVMGMSTFLTEFIGLQAANAQFVVSGANSSQNTSGNALIWQSSSRTFFSQDGNRIIYAELHD